MTEAINERVDRLFPGFGWDYGTGEGGIGHSLLLTGQGEEHLQLLAIHWLSQAPVSEGWTFHASRPAGRIKGRAINILGARFDPKEVWVTPLIDEDNKCIHLTIWHPLWPVIGERERWMVVFLFLDKALSEEGAKTWIKGISLENDRLADSFPLEELPEFVNAIVEREGWEKYLTGVAATYFELKPGTQIFPRSDLLTLLTFAPQLYYDYRESKGKMKDPFANLGADYLYVSIPLSFFPKGLEVAKRHEIEGGLDSALRAQASGRLISGGFARSCAYVDLLIFDGDRSIEIIVETLKAMNLPEGTCIEYFAQEKADRRIRL